MLLKILAVIEEGRLGGPQIRMAMVAHALKGRADILIVMPKADSEQFREVCNRQEVAFLTARLTRLAKGPQAICRYLFRFPGEIIHLMRLFRSEKPDLVHACGGAWQYKAVIAAYFSGFRCIWHLNDCSMPTAVKVIFRLVSRLSDGFIFAADRTKCYYEALIPKKLPQYVIPAPVDTERFCGRGSRSRFPRLLHRWKGKFVVATVANINPIKGTDFLIRVAAEIGKTRQDIHFVAAGPIYESQSKYFDKLQQLLNDLNVCNFELFGPVLDPRPLLDRADIYVCSSNAESSPLAVWEAMSMGKPIISTDVGDVGKHARQGEAAEIVEVEDVQGMARAILSLSLDDSLRRKYAARARYIARTELDISICADKHLEAYSALGGVG